ncbi:membrane-associated protein, putative [Bodo saltans]|uniref:Membrane-associated protein, putative n=1 Tax=Bodo saltans TaxID=75058 RepID=A0A0S4IZT7_BODSA|nr:membrane-associated protein, putative [Bodo saltans]|eukprot:CUG28634.1 membrane-associated protein, putative [Bodo saltans]
MPSSVRIVALVCSVVLSMIVGAAGKHHLDPLHDEDIRMMLEEKGVSTKSLKSRAQLIARWTSLETGGASSAGAVDSSIAKSHKHTVLVTFCSG